MKKSHEKLEQKFDKDKNRVQRQINTGQSVSSEGTI